jgi:hypothetical protein
MQKVVDKEDMKVSWFDALRNPPKTDKMVKIVVGIFVPNIAKIYTYINLYMHSDGKNLGSFSKMLSIGKNSFGRHLIEFHLGPKFTGRQKSPECV